MSITSSFWKKTNYLGVGLALFGAISLCGLLLLSAAPQSSSASPAQSKEKKPPEEESRQALERKTLLLIDQVVSEASGLRLPENRTFVLTRAANLIWPHDEKRARNLFWEAINSLNRNPPKAGDSTRNKNTSYFETFGQRQRIVEVVSKRDPQLALELLQASRQIPPDSRNTEFLTQAERNLEQQIATAAVERDPKKALQLAKESLAKGLSLEIINLMFQLNQRDAELGTRFAVEVVSKIKFSGINSDRNASHIAVSLLGATRRESPDRARPDNVQIKPLNLPKEERRDLADLLSSAALSPSATAAILSMTAEVQSEIEEFFPERIALLRSRLAESQRTLTPSEQKHQHFNSLVRTGRPEEILRASSKGNDEERSWLEREAILAAIFTGKTDLLREFISTQIDDESRRQQILDRLDAEEIDSAVARKDADALRKLLPGIRLKEERARAMSELAIVLETQGEHGAALDLLSEAQSLVEFDLQSETKSNALLRLLVAFAVVEPSRAFTILERSIDRTNSEISKLLLLDWFFKSGFVKKGEMILQHSGALPIDSVMLKYGKGIKALAHADFGRTKAAADRFDRYELRILTRLLIAQSILGGDRML